MRYFVVAGFLLTSASSSPSAIAEFLVTKVVVVSGGIVDVSDRAMVVSVNDVVVSTMLELSYLFFFAEVVVVSTKIVVVYLKL